MINFEEFIYSMVNYEHILSVMDVTMHLMN